MMEGDVETFFKSEQEEVVTSAELTAALEGIKALNEKNTKELNEIEKELSSLISEYNTIYQLNAVCQEHCFNVTANNYGMNMALKKFDPIFTTVEQAISFWKECRKEHDENASAYGRYIASLQRRDWITKKQEAQAEIENLRNTLDKKQNELLELENTRKFKSPVVDNKTFEMFRNKVRSQLRLSSNRAETNIAPVVRPVPARSPIFRPTQQRSPSPETNVVQSLSQESFQQLRSNIGRVTSIDTPIMRPVQEQPQFIHPQEDSPLIHATQERSPSPLPQNDVSQSPRQESFLQSSPVPANNHVVNIMDDMDSQGDFFNFMQGENSNNAPFSFLQENDRTNNSGSGGLFGLGFSPQSQKNTSNNFLF